MNQTILDRRPAAGFAQSAVTGEMREILQEISSPGVAAAIWERELDRSLQAWIDEIPTEQLPELTAILPIDMVEETVLEAFNSADTPADEKQKAIACDIATIAHTFGNITGANTIRLRLDVCDETMCPKFHLDNVEARLLCTYRGAGTQYVASKDQALPERVRQMKTGSVGLFRGAQWKSEERVSLLHRSPPHEATSKSRLLVVMGIADNTLNNSAY